MNKRRTPAPWRVLRQEHVHNDVKFVSFHLVKATNPDFAIASRTLTPRELHLEHEIEADFLLLSAAPALLDVAKSLADDWVQSPVGLVQNSESFRAVLQAEGMTNEAYHSDSDPKPKP